MNCILNEQMISNAIFIIRKLELMIFTVQKKTGWYLQYMNDSEQYFNMLIFKI